MQRNRTEKIERNGTGGALNVRAAARRLREERGLSGVALCRRAQALDPKTLAALEKRRIKDPSIATLQALAKGFDMAVSDLFRQGGAPAEGVCLPGIPERALEGRFSRSRGPMDLFHAAERDLFLRENNPRGAEGF